MAILCCFLFISSWIWCERGLELLQSSFYTVIGGLRRVLLESLSHSFNLAIIYPFSLQCMVTTSLDGGAEMSMSGRITVMISRFLINFFPDVS